MVGSNVFNILVVLGCSALVLPLRVENRLVRKDVPVLLAISSAAWGMASAGRMTWQAGVALLIGLLINTSGRSVRPGKSTTMRIRRRTRRCQRQPDAGAPL